MYRLQIWFEGRWVWGIHDYTAAEASYNLSRTQAVGIKARIKPLSELLN